MALLCESCGYVGDDFASQSESNILRNDAAGTYEFAGDIGEDLAHVGEPQCPQCASYDSSETDDVSDDEHDDDDYED